MTAVYKAGRERVGICGMCLQPTSWRLEVNESNLLLSCSVAMLSPTSRRGDVKINTRWRPLISFHSFSSHPLFCPSPLSLYHLPRHLNFPLLQLPLPLSPHLSSAPFSASHLPLRPPFLTFYFCLPLINIFFLSPRPPPSPPLSSFSPSLSSVTDHV